MRTLICTLSEFILYGMDQRSSKIQSLGDSFWELNSASAGDHVGAYYVQVSATIYLERLALRALAISNDRLNIQQFK